MSVESLPYYFIVASDRSPPTVTIEGSRYKQIRPSYHVTASHTPQSSPFLVLVVKGLISD